MTSRWQERVISPTLSFIYNRLQRDFGQVAGGLDKQAPQMSWTRLAATWLSENAAAAAKGERWSPASVLSVTASQKEHGGDSVVAASPGQISFNEQVINGNRLHGVKANNH